jgi:dCMP deaminase
MKLSWDDYFLKLAILVSERATCSRLHCGCVIVRDKNIISTGYNGSIPGDVHCEDDGCLIVNDHCIRTVHAEQNAIFQAAKEGHSLKGATAYITAPACLNCTKTLIMSGIIRIVYYVSYIQDKFALELMKKANIEIKEIKI